MNQHTVEKIGGTSMSDFAAVHDNIILNPPNGKSLYQRIFVVSAYGGITDMLLEHKKSGKPGIYALFANAIEDDSWLDALNALRKHIHAINYSLFDDVTAFRRANRFIEKRLDDARQCLTDLQRLCQHGHFELAAHLQTVREMLASLGEAHSAWNTTQLLKREGVNACFVDLTGWNATKHIPLDQRILEAFEEIDLDKQLPIVTGYTHSEEGLMATFDRGYSEMTLSRIAVLTGASEAVIHKEYHFSSADPKVVGEDNAVPIGRTNYDVADQLANLGMEAIHPRAATGLRKNGIPLKVKNTFEPEHKGTLITVDYVSETPCAEIIAGCKGVYALEVFDQDMIGKIDLYDREILSIIRRFRAPIVTKDTNANTVTHYLSSNLKTVKRIEAALKEQYPEAEINHRRVAIVSAIGSDMRIQGILAKTVNILAEAGISILAMHQSMRQVDMQFVIDETDYDPAIKRLHKCFVEVHNHKVAISAL